MNTSSWLGRRTVHNSVARQRLASASRHRSHNNNAEPVSKAPSNVFLPLRPTYPPRAASAARASASPAGALSASPGSSRRGGAPPRWASSGEPRNCPRPFPRNLVPGAPPPRLLPAPLVARLPGSSCGALCPLFRSAPASAPSVAGGRSTARSGSSAGFQPGGSRPPIPPRSALFSALPRVGPAEPQRLDRFRQFGAGHIGQKNTINRLLT
jgi:hypothetical protein